MYNYQKKGVDLTIGGIFTIPDLEKKEDKEPKVEEKKPKKKPKKEKM